MHAIKLDIGVFYLSAQLWNDTSGGTSGPIFCYND